MFADRVPEVVRWHGSPRSATFNEPQKGTEAMATEIILDRNAVDGRFVSREYVKKHPRTTVTEHRMKRRSKAPPKRQSKGR